MDKKTITLNGKEYPVVFSMGTLLCFEEIAEKPFIGESFKRPHDRAVLIMSAMLSADDKIEDVFKPIATCSDFQTFNEAFNTVMGMAGDFFRIPSTLTKEPQQVQDAGGGTKNPQPPTTSTE